MTSHHLALTAEEIDALRGEGYLIVPGVLYRASLAAIRARLDQVVGKIVPGLLSGPPLDGVEAGVVHADLDTDDPDLAICHRHPMVSAAAEAVLVKRWRLRELSLRAPLPGFGHQGLHPDHEVRHPGEPWQSLSAMWCISEHTPEAGSLRVIPGSHRSKLDPTEQLAFGSGMGPHPDEMRLVAPAGSLVLFNGADLWHSGTLNYSFEPRLAVTASFVPCSDD